MLIQVLQSIGLSEKESKIYLAMLELGTQPVSIIAKKANLNRTTTYLILEELSQKGLIHSYSKRKVLYYSANSPEHFLIYLKEKKQNLTNQEDLISANLEAFNQITEKRSIKPKVQFFEGLDGVKAVYQDTLTASNTIKSFWGIHTIPTQLSEFIFKDYIPTRVKNNISIEVITPVSNKAIEVSNKDKAHLRTTYFYKEDLPFEIEINIYDNKVALISYGGEEYSGVIIENNKIADALITIHTLAKLYCSKNSKKT